MICPYPIHTKSNVAEVNPCLDDFFYCLDQKGCAAPSFRCHHTGCKGLNRTFARFCTKCGKPLNYQKVFDDHLTSLKIDEDFRSKQFFYLDLGGLDISEIVDMIHFLGYLVVNANRQGILLYNAYAPERGMIIRLEFDEPVHYIQPDIASHNLFVATSNTLYRSRPCNQFQVHCLFREEGIGHRPPVIFNDGSIGIFTQTLHGTIQFKVYQNSIVIFSETFNEDVSFPLLLPDQSLFFFSKKQLYIFANKRIKAASISNSVVLDTNAKAVFSNDNIYLVGEDGPYRVNLFSSLLPFPLSEQRYQVSRISISSSARHIYLTHSRGFSILNRTTGEEEWDISKENKIGLRSACSQFEAREIGKYLRIVFPSKDTAGTIVGFLPKLTRDNLIVTQSFINVKCEPLVMLNKLFIAFKQHKSVNLGVLNLCK